MTFQDIAPFDMRPQPWFGRGEGWFKDVLMWVLPHELVDGLACGLVGGTRARPGREACVSPRGGFIAKTICVFSNTSPFCNFQGLQLL
jgi:hypothetical protein